MRAQRKRRLRRCDARRQGGRSNRRRPRTTRRDELAQTGIAPWEAPCRPQHEQTTALDPLKRVEREQDQYVDPPEIPGAQAVAIDASNLFRHDSVVDRRRLLEGALVEAALQRLGPNQVYAGTDRPRSERRAAPPRRRGLDDAGDRRVRGAMCAPPIVVKNAPGLRPTPSRPLWIARSI